MVKKTGSFMLLILIASMLHACGWFGEDDPEEEERQLMEEWGNHVPVPMYTDFSDRSVTPVNTRVQTYWSELEQQQIIYAVNVLDFGAVPNSNEDAAPAINDAITAARAQFGGGIVFLPAGTYTIRGNINMEPNVSLRGEWLPPEPDTIAEGTVLHVFNGRGLDASANPLIATADSSLVSNLAIYYPSQFTDDPFSYPFSIENRGYFGVEIRNVTLVNSFNGIKVDTNNWLFFRNVYMTALNVGFYNHGIYDIGKWENVNISPEYWSMYEEAIGKSDAVTEAEVREHTFAEATGVVVGRYDWIYMYQTRMQGLQRGIDVQGIFNGILYEVDIHDSLYPLHVTYMSPIGTQITNSRFSAVTSEGVAAKFTEGPDRLGTVNSYRAYTMFNDVTFESEGAAITMDTNGMISVQHSHFASWDPSRYAVETSRGVVVADQNTFAQNDQHIRLGLGTTVAKITGNGPLDVTNLTLPTAAVDIVAERHPMNTDPIRIDLRPFIPYRPAKDTLFYAPDYGLSRHSEDNTEALQHALMDAYENGGGIVVMPGGHFQVRGRLVIPPGVELKGINEIAKHYGGNGQGTVLQSYYGQDQPNAEAFITLSNNAGIDGFSVFYPNQQFPDGIPFADSVHVAGEDAWVRHVTLVNAYNGFRFTGDRFQVDYARGKSIKDFFIVEGAHEGMIHNVLVTIGDWQDAGVPGGPGPEAWKQHPNMDGNRAFVVRDADDLQLVNNFAFGFDRGLELEGAVNRLISYGTGIDASRNAVILNNSGTGNVFINSELVCTENYVWTTASHSGEVDFVNTNNWMANVGDTTIDGTGIVRIQQYKQMTGEVFLKGGTIIFENAIIHSQTAAIHIDAAVTAGLVLNPVGNTTFLDVFNNAPNVDVLHPSRGR